MSKPRYTNQFSIDLNSISFNKNDYNFLSTLLLEFERKIFRMEINDFTDDVGSLILRFRDEIIPGKKIDYLSDESYFLESFEDFDVEEFKGKLPEDKLKIYTNLIDRISRKYDFFEEERRNLEIYLLTGKITLDRLAKEEYRTARIWDSVSLVRRIAWMVRGGKSYEEIVSILNEKLKKQEQSLKNVNAIKKLMSNAYRRKGMEHLKIFLNKEF